MGAKHLIASFTVPLRRAAFGLLVSGLVAGTCVGQELQEIRDRAAEKGIEYLAAAQDEDGTFNRRAGAGVTALCVTSMIRNGAALDSEAVSQGLSAMEAFVKDDGGIYGNDRLKNYETCISVICFAEANKDGRYDEVLDNAETFLRTLQYGAVGDSDPEELWHGGVGYGGPERPDLSNTSFMVEALIAAGAGEEDEAIQRAITFVSRCQNFSSEFNESPLAAKINDGGFTYVVMGDESDVEEDDVDGGLRSSGSMTYSGFKSMIYAGLSEEDPRVKAAVEWIGNHYSVEENPGQGDAGLYYYYYTFATSFDAAHIDSITDGEGTSHDWRADLIRQLGKTQQDDGSWANANGRWMENDPRLATAFALLSLAKCSTDESAE